ncbi:PREDICTED: protein FAM169B [Gekko japonicus]|uniref:Protein FAM169B n=1 Tax=Gekko japonicus TaxID=146911 RepID=A0ABM1L242_GEKJA|nr:PREDICTED: protein FAM169B [Gekko japonicus]
MRSQEPPPQQTSRGKKIVLFVLNYIILGTRERSLTWDAVFMPHSEREHAKLFWRSGEAAAFYTVKPKGSLCDEHSSQCYQLPVLDTVFVRTKFRRRGLGTAMLQDFCETFATEDALGISCPISAEMYQVCQRFLDAHPEEQSRMWEVEAPGDWSQRTSIWLTVQLAQNLPKNNDPACRAESHRDDEPGQFGDSQMNKGAVQVTDIRVLQGQAGECKDDRDEPLVLQPETEGPVGQRGGEARRGKELKERLRRGGPTEDRAPKRLKAASHETGSCS